MIEAIKSWSIKILSGLLPMLFRWMYTSEKILGMIEVTVGSENDGVVIDCSELPEARAWLEITNLSPFILKLTGIEANLYWAGRVAEFKSLERLEIKPHTKERVFLKTSISELQSKHVREKNHINKPRLHVSIYLDSSIRMINKQRDIQTTNIRLNNCGS